MSFVETALPIMIIGFMILVIWAKIEHKRIMDILTEMREFIQEWKDDNIQ